MVSSRRNMRCLLVTWGLTPSPESRRFGSTDRKAFAEPTAMRLSVDASLPHRPRGRIVVRERSDDFIQGRSLRGWRSNCRRGRERCSFDPRSPAARSPDEIPRSSSSEVAASMSDTATDTVLLPAWTASRTMYSQPRSVTCHMTSCSCATTSGGRAKKRSYQARAASKSLTGTQAKRTSTFIPVVSRCPGR